MLRLLHSVSAACFYSLGLAFFVAYALIRNNLWGDVPTVWMKVADLPFLLTGLTYGGISLVLSFGEASRTRHIIGWIVTIPLTVAFLYFLALAFGDVLAL